MTHIYILYLMLERLLHPHSFAFSPPSTKDEPATALIILNSTSPASSLEFLRAVWGCASLRIAADGAAGRVYRDVISSIDSVDAATLLRGAHVPSSEAVAALNGLLPDAVCGDWDSIDSASESFYRAAGCKMLAAPEDQDSTDLMKCLREVERIQVASRARYRVVIYGAFGGRFDHEAQNLNCLFTYAGAFEALVLLSGDTIASLLPRGEWSVRVAAPFEGPTCGLVPLGEAAEITTRGLKWDVTAWRTQFGGHMSTSNHVEGIPAEGSGTAAAGQQVVHISTTAPIIWTLVVNADRVIAAAQERRARAGSD